MAQLALLILDSQTSCLGLPSGEVTGKCHHADKADEGYKIREFY